LKYSINKISFIIIIIFPIIISSCLTMYLITNPPDFYYKSKFNKEIRKDNRILKLLSFKYINNFWDDNIFHIGLELINGNIFLIRVEDSIYNVHGIIEIDNFKISALELDNSGYNSYGYRDGIYYTDGLKAYILEIMLNKQSKYFNNLNNYIDCFDEIKTHIEKIFYEERIPGDEEDNGVWEKDEISGKNIWIGNTDLWGDDEELINYSGYILLDETNRAKIFVNKIMATSKNNNKLTKNKV